MITVILLVMVEIAGNTKTFIVDSAPTGCDATFWRKSKGENISSESNDESYSPSSGIGFSFAMYHRPLS